MKIRTLIFTCLLAVATASVAVDASALKPPAGAKVAIVMFEDLQCPECAHAYPLVWDAANAHKIPVLLRDFPLPRHNWAFDAAVWARYFDQTSLNLGNEFRKFIYANQTQITRENLQQWVQKFGDDHKASVTLPKDPGDKLAEKVKADFALGQRIGVEHSLTLWVVSNNGVSQPLVDEVKDSEQLNQLIDEVFKKETLKKAQPSPAKNLPQKGSAPQKSAVPKNVAPTNISKDTKKAG
ncbi:MAG TPA: thioredoxin domain-containing protein [Candidatus Angelobacter sp.]|nr:thioredoxin domain-containing protein [Candidatus Angelobacter sp.]